MGTIVKYCVSNWLEIILVSFLYTNQMQCVLWASTKEEFQWGTHCSEVVKFGSNNCY